MLQIISTSQPHLDMSALRTLAQSVLDQIKNEGLNSVLNTTISLVQRLAGTEIGRDLIQAMNVIAESEDRVEAAEQGLIDRFKDVLGGQ
jgi:uncharacterized tellurite resistance protein B-like protein